VDKKLATAEDPVRLSSEKVREAQRQGRLDIEGATQQVGHITDNGCADANEQKR